MWVRSSVNTSGRDAQHKANLRIRDNFDTEFVQNVKRQLRCGPNNKANGREPFGATLAPASGVTKGEASRSAFR